MAKKNILYVCEEIFPYLPESEQATLCRALPQSMQEYGNEVRTFMPRYGSINERRNQLHEVIRLSGMNLIISDNDHQLIIKVTSIPSARMQIYFIDNEDFFARKAVLTDDEGKFFADNDDRAIFFARGVLETVKKLRWTPDIIHCQGWFATLIITYIRHIYKSDPFFKNAKIVTSLYDDAFEGSLNPELANKLRGEGIRDKNLNIIENPTYENLYHYVFSMIDGVVAGSAKVDKSLLDFALSTGKKVLNYAEPTSEGFFDNYNSFYDNL